MHSRRFLGVIFFLIFAFSFAFSLYHQIEPATDAQAYEKIGWNLAKGLGYLENESYASDPKSDDAIVRVGPGYEFFLAGIFYIFGHSLFVVWLLQAVLRFATAVLLWRIAFLIFEDQRFAYPVGLLAILFFGFMPDLVVIGGMLLAETLFLFVSLWAVYASLLVFEKNRYPYVISASFAWGYSILVRPTALVPFFIFLGVLFWRRDWKSVFLVILCPFILVGGWSLRNSLLYRTPLFTTTAGPYALWVGNYPEATGGWYKTPEIQNIRNTHHSVELAQIAKEKYWAFLKDRPFKFIELQFRKTVKYFSLIRPTGFWFYLDGRPIERIITVGLSALATAFLFIVGTAGAMRLYKEANLRTRFFLAVLLIQPLVVIPTYVETRYRYPLYPFLAFCAAYLVAVIHHKGLWHVKRVLLLSCFIFLLFTGIDVLYAKDTLTSRLELIFQEFKL